MPDDQQHARHGLRRVRRVKWFDVIEKGVPADGLPWICDWRSYDIPETIEAGIRQAAPGMVAVTLSMLGGRRMIFAAERAARTRGVRVLWWFGPGVNELSEQTKETLRGWVRAARAIVNTEATNA